MMQIYLDRIAKFQQKLNRRNRKSRTLSIARLFLFSLCILGFYIGFAKENIFGWITLFLALIIFLVTIKIHSRLRYQIKIHSNLLEINQKEWNYVTENQLNFQDGAEFLDSQHHHSYDLDIFGASSLFQHLNRTHTFMGAKALSNLLVSNLSPDEIIRNQQSIDELAQNLTWRQDFEAVSQFVSDTEEDVDFFKNWSQMKVQNIPFLIVLASYILPILFVGTMVYGWIQGIYVMNYLVGIFILNLVLSFSQLKKIKREIENSDRVDEITRGYSLLLEEIENQSFASPKLKDLQTKIQFENQKSSESIRELSRLFADLNNIQNVFGAILLNGTIFYHTHRLRKYNQWKSQNAGKLKNWLEVIGEFEALNSLSNLAYNNPSYAFPTLNQHFQIEFKELGHPMIPSTQRITNDISFVEKPFTILTGSNMSGKSTFLRTLGINMVLAGMGSVVCAKSANIHPMPVLVSMRQSDSLSDSESYFFAEVKRLQELMEMLSERVSFVLLDEILRGTNSDDKQSGTMGVIRKLMAKNAIGMIATHDIEVCRMETEFPEKIINRCFEVEIIKDELVFDYKLRNGICKNKSATFLMKKMQIID
jgi:hypothetical protein